MEFDIRPVVPLELGTARNHGGYPCPLLHLTYPCLPPVAAHKARPASSTHPTDARSGPLAPAMPLLVWLQVTLTRTPVKFPAPSTHPTDARSVPLAPALPLLVWLQVTLTRTPVKFPASSTHPTDTKSKLRKPTRWWLTYLLGASLLLQCTSPTQDAPEPEPAPAPAPDKPVVQPPPFSADSAYRWLSKQVEMGPRAPGTLAHGRCATYLESELRRFTPHVTRQQPPVTAHDGKRFTLQNIIARFKPEAEKRILLCAHWDSRPRAEMDSERPGAPILAANDGASGVAVLLEVARNLAANPPPCGIDIVLFDLEDYGESAAENSYCLGSQYWSRTPHIPGYQAEYGILLDMVGGKGARFFREGTSRTYAPHVVDKVWRNAQRLGYGNWFLNQDGNGITDDHYYINKISDIPTIDIIELDPGSETGFGRYWHTHKDDLSLIDPSTLHAVGHTLLFTLFQE